MFEKEVWLEIFAAIKQNKLRTFLTALSVGWGIFILIILLGAGNGLTNGAQSQFAGDAVNSIWVSPGVTSLAYKGFQVGRNLKLKNEDYEIIRKQIKGLKYKTAVYNYNADRNVTYKKERGNYLCRPVMPDHQYLENIKLVSGRFLNQNDINEFRKVCVMGELLKEALFKQEDPLGKYVQIENVPYKIVGVFTDQNQNDMRRFYIPLTTGQRALGAKDQLSDIWVSVGNISVAESEEMAEQIRSLLSSKHQFNREDRSAMYINNNYVEYQRIMNVLGGIRIFVWIIGIMTLIAGIVSVSNIMIIVVKERTREIGIRKAIGATPASIVGLIIQEAILITALAGFTGLALGWGLLSLLNSIGIDSDFFKHPEVDGFIAVSATVLIIVAGAVAGFFPALKAARINPVEALKG
jgi:putative ABC transport system permease protein